MYPLIKKDITIVTNCPINPYSHKTCTWKGPQCEGIGRHVMNEHWLCSSCLFELLTKFVKTWVIDW